MKRRSPSLSQDAKQPSREFCSSIPKDLNLSSLKVGDMREGNDVFMMVVLRLLKLLKKYKLLRPMI